MRKPKIALLSWEYYPMYEGGLGLMAREVSEELIRQGIDVTVLVPNIPKEYQLPDFVVSLQTSLKKLGKTSSQIPELDFALDMFRPSGRKPGPIWPPLFASKKTQTSNKKTTLYPNNTPAISKAFGQAVLKYLQENTDIQLVIGVDWESIPAFHLVKKNTQIPFVFYIHGTEYDRNPAKILSKGGVIFDLEKKNFKLGDYLLSISEISSGFLEKIYQVPKDKITVVFDDIKFQPEPASFAELNKGKNVLFIGRVESQKGLGFLIDTAHKTRQVDPQVRFIVAGDGSGLSSLIDSVAERELERNILFTGWVGDELKKQLYSSSDLFVMPSPSEPFGLTALEAIRSGVPVIASATSGFCAVVPSTPTFNYYDTNTFEQMILFYLNNKEAARTLLAKQQEELSRHSWELEVKKIVKVIHSLSDEKGFGKPKIKQI
jgi:glycogen synthase